ncbi:MAG: outer membrane protein assembly factor BamE [Leptospiraceae bacterium]|nr:outer membrane protein assembly factor BamE [Leptospiraceae bacterium]MCK6381014.1 outer membrane protein assembly factor BamE [Leptospiraceae bacterium]NUM41412.1 outer membrane protein assembly factor BamE [Leptospiraceae bacterium]
MKKLILPICLFTVLGFVLTQCSSDKKDTPRPAVHDNTDLRNIEVDMIKVGDSKVKIQALLGTPTEESNTQNGSVWTWWFISTTYQKNSYQTLKEKPATTEGAKFIKLTFDPKGKVTQKEFDM